MLNIGIFQFQIIFSPLPGRVISTDPVKEIPNKALWTLTLGKLEQLVAFPVCSKDAFCSSSTPCVGVPVQGRDLPYVVGQHLLKRQQAGLARTCPARTSRHSTGAILPTATHPIGVTVWYILKIPVSKTTAVWKNSGRGLESSLIPFPSLCLCESIRLKDTDVLQNSWIQVAGCDPGTSYTSPRGVLQLFSPCDMIAALQYK